MPPLRLPALPCPQAVLGASILTWQGRVHAKGALAQLSRGGASLAGQLLPVLLMFCPIHAFFALWSVTFAFLPFNLAAGLAAATAVPYYVLTSRGNPAETGSGTWPWLRDWFSANIEHSLAYWHGSVEVVRDSPHPPDPAGRYIFGFSPHGLYPTGLGQLPLLPSFKALFPGVAPVTLTASVLHLVPGIRDVCRWAGFRVVTRSSFVRALSEQRAVVMCPGGQAELVQVSRAFRAPEREIVLYAAHKGFCRLAIEQGACLVPTLALGETLQLRNAIELPWLQQATYKRLGFPVPFVVAGRWWTPLPHRVPLKYIVGAPLQPPAHPAGQPVPQDLVDQLHAAFYDSLVALFEKYKHTHPDYVQARLVLLR